MKMISFVFVVLCLLLCTHRCQTQWQPDVRLTNNDSASFVSRGNTWSVAADGNNVHVVWWDYRDGNYEIYTKHSTDGGTVWQPDVRLTNNPAVSGSSSIGVSGETVHVVWNDNRTGLWPLYYKRSTNNGVTWSQDLVLTPGGNIGPTTLAARGQAVYVAWSDARNGNDEIYSMHSSDGGTTWSTDMRLTNNTALSEYPSIAFAGPLVHVVWWDTRDGNSEIYYKRSTDGGSTWKPDTRLTNNPANSGSCSIGASGSFVHVVWDDDRDGNQEVYYKQSTDGGETWSDDTRLTNNSASQSIPCIAVSGSNVHVVWNDYRDGNFEIYYKLSTDAGATWSDDTRLTDAPGTSWSPSIAVTGTAVHVVWDDDRDGNTEIYYKRNPTGNPITGVELTGGEEAGRFELLQNYPNPFNPVTEIRFHLPALPVPSGQAGVAGFGFVTLRVYDIMGRVVATLANEQLSPGWHMRTFDGTGLSSGVYYCRMQAGEFVQSTKLVLVK